MVKKESIMKKTKQLNAFGGIEELKCTNFEENTLVASRDQEVSPPHVTRGEIFNLS
ncbi:hypothetical protein Hdeb2414_s0011g00364111 [Helianthus debilis subsp. tardiflorus]